MGSAGLRETLVDRGKIGAPGGLGSLRALEIVDERRRGHIGGVGRGVETGVEARPTSHLDVSNSLLELLGADPARRRDYSLGESLFAPLATRERVVAGFAHLGLWTDSGIFGIPLRPGEPIEVFDGDWQLQSGTLERYRVEERALLRTVEECVRFLDR